MKKKLPIIHSVKEVTKTRLFTIEEIDIEFENQEKRIYERINAKSTSAVLVMPILNDELLLIREYGMGTEKYELGFVKGGVDNNEDIYVAANRELKEEIGYGSEKLIYLRGVCSSPNTSRTILHIFIAFNLYEEKLEGDEPEPLEVIKYKIKNINKLLQDYEFRDAKNLAALYMLRDYLKKKRLI